MAQAEKAGAIGAILYTDPAEGATLGTSSSAYSLVKALFVLVIVPSMTTVFENSLVFADDTYPNTYYMPSEGVQRGTLYIGDGDPLTPLYPSKPNLWKSLTLEEVGSFY